MNPYDNFKPEIIAAITLLEKNGFEVFIKARIGPAINLKTRKRLTAFNPHNKFDLALGLKTVEKKESFKPVATPIDSVEASIDVMSRSELIAEISKIDGIGNPYTIKSEQLKEILIKHKKGNLNLSDYEK